MKVIRKVTRGIELAEDITQEDIDTMPLIPCPVCGDIGLTPKKRYWVISDPVLLCEDHAEDLESIARKGLDKLMSFKSREELNEWRRNRTNDAEKRIMGTVIQFVARTCPERSSIVKYTNKVCKKLWPWIE